MRKEYGWGPKNINWDELGRFVGQVSVCRATIVLVHAFKKYEACPADQRNLEQLRTLVSQELRAVREDHKNKPSEDKSIFPGALLKKAMAVLWNDEKQFLSL